MDKRKIEEMAERPWSLMTDGMSAKNVASVVEFLKDTLVTAKKLMDPPKDMPEEYVVKGRMVREAIDNLDKDKGDLMRYFGLIVFTMMPGLDEEAKKKENEENCGYRIVE